MEKNKVLVIEDWSDTNRLKEIMAEHGDSQFPFYGENEDGEIISISVFHDRIVLVTEQENGWIRKNFYYPDGTMEELFDGKWNK